MYEHNFSDETKIMLHYHDGPQRVCRKPLTALENKNRIPTLKFGKLSVLVGSCVSSKGCGIVTSTSVKKFGFVDHDNPNKLKYKYWQDNNVKNKSYLCRSRLLYNCTKVIDTRANSSDFNPIEILCVHLKRKVEKRSPTNNMTSRNVSKR